MRNKNWENIILIIIIILLKGLCFNNGEIISENVGEMEKIEKENLYSAIQGFVGHWWNGSDLYPDPCGWTPIQGVSCDLANGLWYVTELTIGPLHDNSLVCSENPLFNPQVFDLKHLKSLSFYNCFSSDNLVTLPTDKWSYLASNLESLEFRSNPSLIGPLPFTFGSLQLLKSLVIIDNGFTGELPSNIASLSQLKRLVLSGNNFTGRVFDTIGDLSGLLILDLSRNSLSGHIPMSIGYLKSLLKLDLSNNLLTGNIPREINNLKNLTLLDLKSNYLSGGLTQSIEEMTSLEELVLSNNRIGGEIMNVNWENMQNLMILDLSNAGLLGKIPSSIAKLKKLRYMGLDNNGLTGILSTELANMPSVNAIYVNGNNLTGVLNFSSGFYEKLGKRFKAWNNPNLCYIGEVIASGHAPFGVKPCSSDDISGFSDAKLDVRDGAGRLQEELVWVSSIEESVKLNSDYNSSFGLSKYGTNGVWLVFLVEFFTMMLLWNFFK